MTHSRLCKRLAKGPFLPPSKATSKDAWLATEGHIDDALVIVETCGVFVRNGIG